MKPATPRSILLALFFVAYVLAASSTEHDNEHTLQLKTDHGPVEVHWGPSRIEPYKAAPAFAQLDENTDGYITGDEARSYQPLVNEFDHADLNRDGRISKAEYARWH